MKKRMLFGFLLSMVGIPLLGCGNQADLSQLSESDNQNQWGVSLQAESVTSSGLTIVCKQSGGDNVSELLTGSYYVLQQRTDNSWKDVDYLPHDTTIVWTSEAWIIPKENTTAWDVDWGWLYGKLSAGEYRIGKKIMNSRKPGDFDEETVYAVFTIRTDEDAVSDSEKTGISPKKSDE